MKKLNPQYLILFIALWVGAVSMWVASVDGPEPAIAETVPQTNNQPEAVKPATVPKNGHMASITWFGRECYSEWCKANKDKPRTKVVAVNVKKFGWPKKVYIPVWDAWYDVIPKPYTNTDGKTDIDVWCLDDVKCQQQVGGGKTLLVNMIY